MARAFTLIELFVVLAVFGLLAGLLLPALADGSVHPTKTETLRAQIRAILAGEATEVVLSKPRGHP